MKHACTTCNSSFWFSIGSAKIGEINKEGIMHMTILWECPVCSQVNELRGWFSYSPIKLYEFPA